MLFYKSVIEGCCSVQSPSNLTFFCKCQKRVIWFLQVTRSFIHHLVQNGHKKPRGKAMVTILLALELRKAISTYIYITELPNIYSMQLVAICCCDCGQWVWHQNEGFEVVVTYLTTSLNHNLVWLVKRIIRWPRNLSHSLNSQLSKHSEKKLKEVNEDIKVH